MEIHLSYLNLTESQITPKGSETKLLFHFSTHWPSK